MECYAGIGRDGLVDLDGWFVVEAGVYQRAETTGLWVCVVLLFFICSSSIDCHAFAVRNPWVFGAWMVRHVDLW